MTYNTDERLKCFLDANQLGRERLCVAVLGTDRRFTNIQPQHPRGGPDQGKDITALYEGSQHAACGIGFLNQANDSAPQKTKIRKKFREDLESACKLTPRPTVFVFFTNVNLTISDKSKLYDESIKNGMISCDIFDRERIRIALDSSDGFAARFQYLGVPLSEAEQATFFAKWGSDIQGLILNNFSDVKNTLNQMLFLQESARVLQSIYVIFDLDRTYSSDEIGHLRAFLVMHLKEPKNGIFGIEFGCFDCPGRASSKRKEDPDDMIPGISHGIGSITAEMNLEKISRGESSQEDEEHYQEIGRGNSLGPKEAARIVIEYTHDDWMLRLEPRLRLGDLDESMFMPLVNKSFSEKIESIRLVANGYKLYEIQRNTMWIQEDAQGFTRFLTFAEHELKDPWVKIRPKHLGSAHWLRFQHEVPLRLYDSKFIPAD